jgi:ribosomal-protein-alanine N-acetyltransferase
VGDLRTQRLLLRQWREEDRAPFADLNADPVVVEHFPAPLDRAASDALLDRARAHLEEHGWGLWAVEVVEPGPGAGTGPGGDAGPRTGFAGFTGLDPVSFRAPFTPAVEVGWRLARWAWGHGYATEAATAALRTAFDDLGLEEVVSFTATVNTRSRAVMERLGLRRDPAEDFDHPRVPVGSPLRRHVLYRTPPRDRR